MRFETISPQLIRGNTVEEHEGYLFFFCYQKNLSAKFLLLWLQFWHRDVSAHGYFSTMNVPDRDVTGLGHFVTGIFQQMDISVHVIFGTIQSNILKWLPAPKHPLCWNIQARISQWGNVSMPECPHAKKGKKSLSRKVHMPKSPHAKTSTVMKCPFAGMSVGPKSKHAKMSMKM